MTQQQLPKQGGAIGGWLCFALGISAMVWSVWSFILYVPLFFVSFVLSIVALAQRRIVSGAILLVATIVVPGILWLVLSATRASKFIDDHPSPLIKQAQASASRSSVEVINPLPSIATPTPASQFPISQAPAPAVEKPAIVDNSKQENEGRLSREKAQDDALYNDNLAAAGPLQIAVKKKRLFDARMDSGVPPAFSHDAKRALYVADRENNQAELIIRDLRSLEVVKTLVPTSNPVMLAWSPDEHRIAYYAQYSKFHILEVNTGRDIEIPADMYNGNLEYLFWPKASEIHVKTEFGQVILDLDTLRVVKRDIPIDERNGFIEYHSPSALKHRQCALAREDLDEGRVRGSYLFITQREGPAARPLLNGIFASTAYFATPDLRHLLVADSNLHVVDIYTLGVQPGERPTWRIDIDNSKLLNSEQRAKHKSYLQDKIPFWGKVYAPQVNPLNGKVIGPNTDSYKGRIFITKWTDTYAVAVTGLEMQPFVEGDVVASIASESWQKKGNWPFEYENEWRVLKISGAAISTPNPPKKISETAPSTDGLSALLVGKWKGMSGNKITEYLADGTCVQSGSDSEFRCGWRILNNSLIYSFPDKRTNSKAIVSISETELVLKNIDNSEVHFDRVSQIDCPASAKGFGKSADNAPNQTSNPERAITGTPSSRFTGFWNSPRHGYVYRQDGTWSMLPEVDGGTGGSWKIQGDILTITYSNDPPTSKPSVYTILSLDQNEITYKDTERNVVYRLKRP